MSCGRTITIEVGCGNTLEVIIPTPEVFTVEITQGAIPKDIWQKHTVYVDPDTVTLQNDLFAGEVGDIIYIDGQSFLWANNGTSLGAVTKTGDTFDFSGYGEGAIGGWLTFEYRRLP